MSALGASVALLAQKAPDELEAYRALVLDVANAVAEAKGGVKEEESAAIERITGALGNRSASTTRGAHLMKDETPFSSSGGFVDGPHMTQTLSPKRSSSSSAGGGIELGEKLLDAPIDVVAYPACLLRPMHRSDRRRAIDVAGGRNLDRPTLRPIVTITSAPRGLRSTRAW